MSTAKIAADWGMSSPLVWIGNDLAVDWAGISSPLTRKMGPICCRLRQRGSSELEVEVSIEHAGASGKLGR
jgi:hypothetical protein